MKRKDQELKICKWRLPRYYLYHITFHWIEEDINSVWIRDYGPRIICEGEGPTSDVRAGMDTKYSSNRPLDDKIPSEVGSADRFDHNNYDANSFIIHSGGNGHYFSTKKAFDTAHQ